MTRNIPLSPASCSIISTWYGYEDGHGGIRYITPTVDGVVITLTVPEELAGARFESAHLSHTRTGAAGSVKLFYRNSGVTVTDDNLLAHLAAGETEITMYCSFRAEGGRGGEGVHTAVGGLSGLMLTVEYVPASGITGTLTSDGRTLYYSCGAASLAPGETAEFTLSTDESASEGTLTVNGKEYPLLFSAGRAQVLFTVEAEELTNRLTAAVLSAVIVYGETETAFPETETDFMLVKNRLPPVITVMLTDAAGVRDEFGSFVAGQSEPVARVAVSADTDADSGIAVVMRTLMIDGVPYSLAAGETAVDSLAAGNHVWSAQATDSFGMSASVSGSFTVLPYAPPAVTALEVQRCAVSYDGEGHEVLTADDGSPDVWLTLGMEIASVAAKNAWSADLILDGEETIELTDILSGEDGETVSLTRDRTLLSGTQLDVTKSYSVTLVVRDAFSEKRFSCADIPAAGGVLNIERGGVSIGARSTGSAQEPLFEVAWPAVFRGGVSFPGEDSGWVGLNTSGITPGGLSVRKRLSEVFLTGSFRLNTALSSGLTGAAAGKLNIASLPEGWAGREMVFPVILDKSSGCVRLHITQEGTVYLENRSGYALSSNLDIVVNVNWLI